MTELSEAISSAGNSLTKLEQRIASYLKSRPEVLAIESSAEIAKKLNVSPMTVSRFFKKLGYESSSEAKTKIKADLYGPSANRMGNRYDEFNISTAGRDFRGDQKVAMAGIDQVFKHRTTAQWQEIVKIVAESDMIFAIGIQTMHYLAMGFGTRMRFIRNDIVILADSDGVYGEFFSSSARSRVLIIIDAFRYGTDGPRLARAAREQGAEVIVFCDEFCEWAADITDKIVMLPNESYFFLGMPIGINFALSMLIQDVVLALGERGKAHVERVSEFQEQFGTYVE